MSDRIRADLVKEKAKTKRLHAEIDNKGFVDIVKAFDALAFNTVTRELKAMRHTANDWYHRFLKEGKRTAGLRKEAKRWKEKYQQAARLTFKIIVLDDKKEETDGVK